MTLVGIQLKRNPDILQNQKFWNDDRKRLFETAGLDTTDYNFPKVDVAENGDEYLIRAELPGFDKKNLEIKLEKTILSIRGTRDNEIKNAKWISRERFHGKFVRHFSLPEHIDANKLRADYSNGILAVTIPKKEKAKLREIKVS